MRIKEITETPVASSWLTDLTLTRQGDSVVMATRTGSRYRIQNMPRELYTQWLQSASKGEFWHARVQGRFPVTRLQPQ